ncbi:tyrosine-type recombinase/integrase [Paenibacillus sp. GCM10023248]|uniref:tyrosine-type recombinase/integrase n=1 Tax=unclassified Paenibacillus TaxID=185978 RepID=UPI00237840C8|nr:tyrosine-type recombinase/integrase [Paenibacillus sp. MAHUQ-63]MDD9271454.1 tyrosine-type recombinase/integrase [Paenibacillus sp. MAHUQ-63]
MRLLTRDLSDFFAKRNYSPGRFLDYSKRVEHFANYLSKKINIPQNEIDLSQIIKIVDARGELIAIRPINGKIMDEYFRDLSMSYSYCTLINTRHVLVSFFQFLERNYRFKNPLRELTFDFKSLKPVSKQGLTLSRHEILKLLNAIVAHSNQLTRDLLLFSLLLSTGRRISEILQLKMGHFDFSLNTYKLENTKSKRQFVVPMISGMGDTIQIFCQKNELLPTSFLFQGVKGRPLTRDYVSRLLHKYCDLAGISRFSIHTTRKTFATLLYEEGVDISIIQQFLDHVSCDTTQIYVKSGYIRNYGLKLNANQNLYTKFKSLG